jgi:hypothetical protein
MMSFPEILCWDYLFSSWAIAAAAGVVAVVTLSLWRYFSPTTSFRIYLAVVGLTLGTASLFAWQKYRESIRVENLSVLKTFDAEADRLFEESLTINNAADYTTYQAKADGFSARLEGWVANNMGPRASEVVLRHDPKGVNVAFDGAIGKNHALAMSEIIQTRENIAALIGARASDKCVKPTTAEHPIPKNLD